MFSLLITYICLLIILLIYMVIPVLGIVFIFWAFDVMTGGKNGIC